MILYFERKAAETRRDWLLRLAQSPNPSAASFREQADRLTREIDECKQREAPQ